jgi:hypothetical protein
MQPARQSHFSRRRKKGVRGYASGTQPITAFGAFPALQWISKSSGGARSHARHGVAERHRSGNVRGSVHLVPARDADEHPRRIEIVATLAALTFDTDPDIATRYVAESIGNGALFVNDRELLASFGQGEAVTAISRDPAKCAANHGSLNAHGLVCQPSLQELRDAVRIDDRRPTPSENDRPHRTHPRE